MELPAIEPCKCGRQPEENVSLRTYRYSLSCVCGGPLINYLARADNQIICIDNWNSRVTGSPFKHPTQELPDPDADPIMPPYIEQDPYFWDADPLRRKIREQGGFVGGPWGGCS